MPPSILLVPGTVLGFMESLKGEYNVIPALYRQEVIWLHCKTKYNQLTDCSVMPVNNRPACALALLSLAEHISSLRSCWPQSDQVLSQSFHLLIDFPTSLRDFLNSINYYISMWVLQNLVSRSNGGTSLAVQWLRLHASTAGGVGSIPGWETKIPHAARCRQKKKKVMETLVGFDCCISLPFSHPPSLLKFPFLSGDMLLGG